MRQLFTAPAATFDGARMVQGELLITDNCCSFAGAGISREMDWDSLTDVEATVMEVTVPGPRGPRQQSALRLKNGSQTQLWLLAAQPAQQALDAIVRAQESMRAAATAEVKPQEDTERIRALEARAAEAEARATAAEARAAEAEERAEKAETRASMAEARAEKAEARVKSLCSQLATSEEQRLAVEAALARAEEAAAAARAVAEPVETAEEPEVVEVAEPVEEPEVAEAAEPVAEPEVVEAAEHAEEPEVVEAAEPVEEPEVAEVAEPVEEPEVVETAEPVEEPEVVEAAEPVEEPEVVEAAEPVEEPEVVEAAEPVAEPEVAEVAESAAEPEVAEVAAVSENIVIGEPVLFTKTELEKPAEEPAAAPARSWDELLEALEDDDVTALAELNGEQAHGELQGRKACRRALKAEFRPLFSLECGRFFINDEKAIAPADFAQIHADRRAERYVAASRGCAALAASNGALTGSLLTVWLRVLAGAGAVEEMQLLCRCIAGASGRGEPKLPWDMLDFGAAKLRKLCDAGDWKALSECLTKIAGVTVPVEEIDVCSGAARMGLL